MMRVKSLAEAAGQVAWPNEWRIAVVIPCFKVTRHVANVISQIGPEVGLIYCVDDACPDGSGDFIAANVCDNRVRVLRKV